MTQTENVPKWATETPEETHYDLSMDDSDGVSVQLIELDREEFIFLKACLAEKR